MNRLVFKLLLLICLMVAAVLDAPQAQAHPGFKARIAALTVRIAANPDMPGYYALRAAEYSQHGDYQLAEADFMRAAELGARSAILVAWAQHHMRRDQFAAALGLLNERLSAVPDDMYALRVRARVHTASNRQSAALSDYLRHIELAAGNVRPQDVLAAVDLLLLQPDGPVKAINLIDKAQAQAGQNLGLQRRAVALLRDGGQLSAALQRWRDSEELARSSLSWMVDLADLHMASGQPHKAKALLQQAMARLANLKPTPARRYLALRARKLLKNSS